MNCTEVQEPEILKDGQSIAQTYTTMKMIGDAIVRDYQQIQDEEPLPILREEMKASVKVLKKGKSAKLITEQQNTQSRRRRHDCHHNLHMRMANRMN